MNLIGWIGLFYIFSWNFLTLLAWVFASKEDRRTIQIGWLIILLTTIPTFLLGWFGNE